MTRWSELAVEVQVPADVAHEQAMDLLRQEAVSAGLLSAGLVAGDVVGDLAKRGERGSGARTYRLSFLAEHPLDVDQVGAILVRRLRKRLESDRVTWLCVAYQRPARSRTPTRRHCRPGGA